MPPLGRSAPPEGAGRPRQPGKVTNSGVPKGGRHVFGKDNGGDATRRGGTTAVRPAGPVSVSDAAPAPGTGPRAAVQVHHTRASDPYEDYAPTAGPDLERAPGAGHLDPDHLGL